MDWILVREGLVLSRELATLTALNLGLPMIDLRNQTIEPEAVGLIPEDTARKNLVLGLTRTDGHLGGAMTDPTDLQLLQDLATRTGRSIDPVISTQEDIQEHVDLSYRLTPPLVTDAKADAQPAERVTARRLRDALPVQVIEMLLRQALQDGASDIHVEPMENRLRIRIDGIFHEVMNLPVETHPTIISRLKIMCGMNIAERRRPQDGQLNFEAQGRSVDVRVAISGTVTGEMSVLRLLDNKKFTLLGLDQLGFNTEAQQRYRRLLQLPYGMIVICGPTGSGKSTILYASILQMDRAEKKNVVVQNGVITSGEVKLDKDVIVTGNILAIGDVDLKKDATINGGVPSSFDSSGSAPSRTSSRSSSTSTALAASKNGVAPTRFSTLR